ncbi:unnamed protein product [Bemisia tabaci]|uniref:Uncharacterized protein n=1 Tax=Bemisia tabaci TaxID=7038 RepID=A0A9P0F657_BEMTA|nr:unnamed protein product [Bemisia tabaci]
MTQVGAVDLGPAVDLASNLWAALPPKIFDEDITPMQARTKGDVTDNSWDQPQRGDSEYELKSKKKYNNNASKKKPFEGKASLIYYWFLGLLAVHIMLAVTLSVLAVRFFRVYAVNRVLGDRATYLQNHPKAPIDDVIHHSESNVRAESRTKLGRTEKEKETGEKARKATPKAKERRREPGGDRRQFGRDSSDEPDDSG